VNVQTVPGLLLELVEQDATRPLVRHRGGLLTRQQVIQRASGVAVQLHDRGVGAGDPVVIMLPNSAEFVLSWFGISLAGAVQVPVNPDEVGARLVHLFNHSRAEVAIAGDEYLPALEAVLPELTCLKTVLVLSQPSVGLGRFAVGRLDMRTGSDQVPDSALAVKVRDPTAVMYTSGSTGPAKGVVLSNGHHLTNGRQPVRLFGLDRNDIVYLCLPLHHNMAQGYGVMAALASGGAVAIDRRFRASEFLDAVRHFEATVFPFVGAMLALIAKLPAREDDTDNPLRVGYGIPIPDELHRATETRFGLRLAHCYGSTEATIVSWMHNEPRVFGSAGTVLPEYDVMIADSDDRPLPAGEVGQICVRPRDPFTMFSGYYRDPQRTVDSWRNLWFHTGDRGRFDEANNLWFVDRMGEGIRRLGEFISSHEVEQVLNAHPDIQTAAVFGVPSDLIEEEVMAVIVPRPGVGLHPQDVRTYCAGKLPRHAVPRYIQFRASIPMTATGKVEKYRLKAEGVWIGADDARAHANDLNQSNVIRAGSRQRV
jgi:crotonobetaine/carnitine-CoA ligase